MSPSGEQKQCSVFACWGLANSRRGHPAQYIWSASLIYALFFFATLAGGMPAIADQSSGNHAGIDPGESQIIEEVIVTAMRREMPLERVPGSVSVLGGDNLRQSGASTFTDYARSVPGLTFNDGQGFGGQKYVIRGVSTDVVAEYRATTAVYFDESPVTDGGHSGMTYSPDPLLIDVSRVEVLRGPQGALFGAGSMGGAIRIISNRPNPSKTEGFAEMVLSDVRYGGPGYDIRAMLNTPLANNEAALRAVAYYRDLDGWIDNTTLDQPDVNDNRTTGLRLAGSWIGHERLELNAKIVYQDRKSDGTLIDQESPNWTQQRASEEPNQDRWTLVNLDVIYDFDRAEFVSTTSWHERDVDTRSDVTEFFGYTTVTAVNEDDLDEFVQEFRLASTGDGRINWLTGLFYQDHDYFFGQDFPAPGFDDFSGGLTAHFGHPDNLYTAQTYRTMQQLALFGDLSWDLGDRWEAEIGGRWFRYDHASRFVGDGYFNGGYNEEYVEADDDGFVPRLSLTYTHTNDLNLYSLISGGYRPGGTNEPSGETFPECIEDLEEIGLDGIPRTFQPDSLWNYELGMKSYWADRSVALNMAVYYIDWSDIQTMQFLDCGVGFHVNSGEAISKGFEVELLAYPGPSLELTFNASYSDARLSEDSTNLGGPKGSELPGVPDWTLGGSFTWFFSVFQNTNSWLRFEYQYVGSSWNSVVPDYRTEIPSHSLANIRTGVGRGQWEVTLFVNNLFNERAIIGVHNNFAGQYVTTGKPLTFGGSFRIDY